MSILHGTEQKEKIVLNLRILKKIKTRLLTFKASVSLKEINDRSRIFLVGPIVMD